MTTPMPAFDSVYTSMPKPLTAADVSGVIELAWSDHVSFEMIEAQCGLNESAVCDIMRDHLKSGSYQVWRQRVQGRSAKHSAKHTQQRKGTE